MSKRTSLLIYILVIVIALYGMCCGAEPPSPPAPQTIGRQHPYLSTTTALHTQVVTTVTERKFLRTIEVMGGGTDKPIYETNFVVLRTNLVSVTTNDVVGVPQ